MVRVGFRLPWVEISELKDWGSERSLPYRLTEFVRAVRAIQNVDC